MRNEHYIYAPRNNRAPAKAEIVCCVLAIFGMMPKKELRDPLFSFCSHFLRKNTTNICIWTKVDESRI